MLQVPSAQGPGNKDPLARVRGRKLGTAAWALAALLATACANSGSEGFAGSGSGSANSTHGGSGSEDASTSGSQSEQGNPCTSCAGSDDGSVSSSNPSGDDGGAASGDDDWATATSPDDEAGSSPPALPVLTFPDGGLGGSTPVSSDDGGANACTSKICVDPVFDCPLQGCFNGCTNFHCD